MGKRDCSAYLGREWKQKLLCRAWHMVGSLALSLPLSEFPKSLKMHCPRKMSLYLSQALG